MTYAITHDSGEVFTFEDGMIDSVQTSITVNEPDENIIPGSGPMGNEVYDFGGATKTISVRGKLYDAQNGTVTSATTITTILQMKYWLESLISAAQAAKSWTSPLDQYSLLDGTGTTTIDSASIPGTWVTTKVYVMGLEYPDDTDHVGNQLPFTLTLKVAGI